LNSSGLQNSFFVTLCRASLSEALFFLRRQDPASQPRLLGMLITAALKNTPVEHRPETGVELIELPLNADEERWFEEYLTKGEGQALAGARDALLARWAISGKWQKVVNDAGTGSADAGGWRHLTESLGKGLDNRKGLENWMAQ
jgi:hypothetical protein